METSDEHEVMGRAIAGCLVGGAIGDALGLPCEGLSPARQARLFGRVVGHRLVWGRGLVSDDTEHALLAVEALIGSAGDAERFERDLAHGLRRWIIALPAGVGLATLRACVRLCVGVPPARSGVRSAGNGPLMRAAVLGVAWGHDLPRLRDLVCRSSRITHTDILAERGALVVAVAAQLSSRGRLFPADLRTAWEPLQVDTDSTLRIEDVLQSVPGGEATGDFARRVGMERGVSGYVARTLPVALHAALSHPNNFAGAVQAVIACGGDTDTTGAIVGGIVGAGVGASGVPMAWRTGLAEPFLTLAYLDREATRLAKVLATGQAAQARFVPYPLVLVRNLGFLGVVLYHGLRRLLPPF